MFMNYRLLLIILSLMIISCSKNDNTKTDNDKNKDSITEDIDDTTSLSPQEAFSAVLTDDFIDEGNDEDLQIYLEDEIYPMISGTNKLTFNKISSSMYLLSYTDNGEYKNLLIQKFYNVQKDEVFFEKEFVNYDAKKFYIK
jgi:hypothetical protein